MSRIYASEFVLPGHPDKLCDAIADALVQETCTPTLGVAVRGKPIVQAIRDRPSQPDGYSPPLNPA